MTMEFADLFADGVTTAVYVYCSIAFLAAYAIAAAAKARGVQGNYPSRATRIVVPLPR